MRYKLTPRLHAGAPPAFTLIELLVVVGVIALLTAIILPSLADARRHARGAVCLSNMRQIAIAVTLYAGDNREACPQTMETITSQQPQTISWWAIDNYQKSLEPYLAQERGGVESDGLSRGKRTVWFDPADPDLDVPVMWGSFSDNGLITGVGRRLSQVRSPSQTVFATLRAADWANVISVSIPNPLPLEQPDDPFWTSEYFDMCLDPWAENVDAAHPYHWSKGRALPPISLFSLEPVVGTWDEQVDGRTPGHPAVPLGMTRYGGGRVPFSYLDGHAAMQRFEMTYAFPESNEWDVR